MNMAGMNMLRATIPSFVILAMFAFGYVGILPLYFAWDDYRYLAGVHDKAILLKVFAFTIWSILTMMLGFLFSKYAIGLRGAVSIDISLRPFRRVELWAMLGLLLFCFTVLLPYLSKIPKIALFVALTEGAKEAKIARSLMGNDFAGKYHWYSLVMHDYLNFGLFAVCKLAAPQTTCGLLHVFNCLGRLKLQCDDGYCKRSFCLVVDRFVSGSCNDPARRENADPGSGKTGASFNRVAGVFLLIFHGNAKSGCGPNINFFQSTDWWDPAGIPLP
jgi:hypothetical protein